MVSNNPPTKAGNGGFPANAQGVCYTQGVWVAGAVTGSAAIRTWNWRGSNTKTIRMSSVLRLRNQIY